MCKKECKISWDTGKSKNEYDLLKDDYLKRVGINDVSEIKSVKPFFAFPEKPYTEEGIASNHHPCIGSGGAEIETLDGETAMIEEIFYYDYGHGSGDLEDVEHYNKEGRFTPISGSKVRTTDVDDHIILNPTDHIDITLTTISGNKTQRISGW